MLVSPKEKQSEIREIRKKLDEYLQFKKSHVEVGRRDRALRWGWRHGVTGLENADSQNISVFYREMKEQKDKAQAERQILNK